MQLMTLLNEQVLNFIVPIIIEIIQDFIRLKNARWYFPGWTLFSHLKIANKKDAQDSHKSWIMKAMINLWNVVSVMEDNMDMTYKVLLFTLVPYINDHHFKVSTTEHCNTRRTPSILNMFFELSMLESSHFKHNLSIIMLHQ